MLLTTYSKEILEFGISLFRIIMEYFGEIYENFTEKILIFVITLFSSYNIFYIYIFHHFTQNLFIKFSLINILDEQKQ